MKLSAAMLVAMVGVGISSVVSQSLVLKIQFQSRIISRASSNA